VILINPTKKTNAPINYFKKIETNAWEIRRKKILFLKKKTSYLKQKVVKKCS